MRPVKEHTAERVIYGQYSRRAALKGRVFSLTFPEFLNLISAPCQYCMGVRVNHWRVVPRGKTHSYDLWYNGIDRKDNSQGYSLDNSVSCCKFCNRLKGAFKEEEFREWILRLRRSD